MISLHHTAKNNVKAHWLAETAGWVGAISVLVAYVLVLNGVIDGDGFWNAFLNLVGAIGIITIAIIKKVVQSIVLNIIWAVIAVVAIVNIWLG
jgi:hypothetical protein